MLFQKDAVTKSKSQKCNMAGTLAVLDGKFLPILLQLEQNRRLVL